MVETNKNKSEVGLGGYLKKEPEKFSEFCRSKLELPTGGLSSSKSARVLPSLKFDIGKVSGLQGDKESKQQGVKKPFVSSVKEKKTEVKRKTEKKLSTEPRTPTFNIEDEKIEGLRNLNKKIEEEYKASHRKKVGTSENPKKLKHEGSCKDIRLPEIKDGKGFHLNQLLSDFHFFSSASKVQKKPDLGLECVQELRKKTVSMTRRERPKIKKKITGLPEGVFIIRN